MGHFQSVEMLKSEGMTVNTGFVVTLRNYRNIPNIIDLFLNAKVDSCTLFISSLLFLSHRMCKWVIDKIQERKNADSIDVSLQGRSCSSFSSSNSSFTPCVVGRFICHIEPCGDVYPCIEWPLKAGNVRKSAFSRIWKVSPILTQIRRIKIDNRCGKCNYIRRCIGGCIGLFFKNQVASKTGLRCKKLKSLSL